MFRYFSLFIFLTLIGYLYEKYKLKFEPDEELKKYDMVQKFLLNGGSGFGSKPLLWIHTKHITNSRMWSTFGSRNTNYLNQPYKVTCVEKIVKHCSNSFNICLIDDYSFHKIIPGWSIDMDKIATPIKCHMRTLALSKLLYTYGGLLLPNSTLVFKDLKPLYDSALQIHDCFSVNLVNRTVTSEFSNLIPNIKIIGCKKKSKTMKDLVNYLEILTGTDYTNESDFLGKTNIWLSKKHQQNKLNLVCGKLFGSQDEEGKEVNIDRLMGDSFIKFDDNKYAIYIPDDEILKRTKYQWFARLSQQQLRDCDTILAKFLLVA